MYFTRLSTTSENLNFEFLKDQSLGDVLMNLTIKRIAFANTSNIEKCNIAIADGAHAFTLIFDNGILETIEDITNQYILAPYIVLSKNSHVFIATKEQFQLRD